MNALKKVEQAKYHLDLMKAAPPDGNVFLFNLASFISSAREVTWYLQKEFSGNPKFEDWYTTKQQQMREDETFRFFLNKRNIVVKETFPEVKGYTGYVTFYYINGEGKVAVGECWAHVCSTDGHHCSGRCGNYRSRPSNRKDEPKYDTATHRLQDRAFL